MTSPLAKRRKFDRWIPLEDREIYNRVKRNELEIEELSKKPWDTLYSKHRIEKLRFLNERLWESIREGRKQPAGRRVTEYAESSCRQLCNAIRAKLPREIRDEIYTYLQFEYTNVCIWYPQCGKSTIRELLLEGDCWEEETHYAVHSPWTHCFDPKYVGEEVAREILERFYTVNAFEINLFTRLEQFLTDRSILRIAPADYLRTLRVFINDSILSRHDTKDEAASRSKNELSPISKQTLCESLRSLLVVKYPRGFYIELVIFPWFALLVKRWENIVACIHPVCLELRNKGFVMNVFVMNVFVMNVFVMNVFVMNVFVMNVFVMNVFVMNVFVMNELDTECPIHGDADRTDVTPLLDMDPRGPAWSAFIQNYMKENRNPQFLALQRLGLA